MKKGQLVKWSNSWLGGCIECGNLNLYIDQIGIVIDYSNETPRCWKVAWNNGEVRDVHIDYLEVI